MSEHLSLPFYEREFERKKRGGGGLSARENRKQFSEIQIFNLAKIKKDFDGDKEKLINATELKPVSSGANLLMLIPYDEEIFYATQKVRDKNVVSNVQLYLDLYNYKGRGREQAEYLRDKAIKL